MPPQVGFQPIRWDNLSISGKSPDAGALIRVTTPENRQKSQ